MSYKRILFTLLLSVMLLLNRRTTAYSQQTGPIYNRERSEEINRQLTDYGRILHRNDTLETKSAYCDTFVADVRKAMKGFFVGRRKRVEKVLVRIKQ